MAELLRPLCDAAEERVTERLGAAPGTEDVELRVSLDHTAPVLDDVAGAGAALERDVAQTRVDRDVDAVEVVGEGEEVVDLLVLRRLDVAERHRIAPAAWQPAILRHVEHKRVEISRRPRTVDRGGQVTPGPADVVHLH